jgi:cell division protein FtsQ
MTLRRRRVVAAVTVGAIAVALLGWALTYTPLFDARHIQVVGAEQLRADVVRSRAGIDGSTNVVHVDLDAVVARLLEDPWIASASVRRELPSTLVVQIVERRPIAVIQAMGETSILASDATTLPVTDANVAGLPMMRAALGAPDDAQRRAAADQLVALDPVVLHRVSAITVGQDERLALTMRDGVTVDAGLPGEEAAKAAALRAVLRWAAGGSHTLATIDVSAPAAPSATLADGSSVTP